jgi:hypothetical protein
MALKEYDITFQGYATSSFIQTNCNSVTFTNLGTATAYIDQLVPLLQNQSLTIDGNECEITRHIFQVTFDTSVSGATNNLLVILKSYLNA